MLVHLASLATGMAMVAIFLGDRRKAMVTYLYCMSDHKKHRCVCQKCSKKFRAKKKFKKFCPDCNKKCKN